MRAAGILIRKLTKALLAPRRLLMDEVISENEDVLEVTFTFRARHSVVDAFEAQIGLRISK